VNDVGKIFFLDASEASRAEKVLAQMIKQEDIQAGRGFERLISSKDWNRFSQNLCCTGTVKVFTDVRLLVRTFCLSYYFYHSVVVITKAMDSHQRYKTYCK